MKNNIKNMGKKTIPSVESDFALAFFIITWTRQTEMNTVCLELCKVHGVGPKTAVQWYKSGIRSIQQAQQRVSDGKLTRNGHPRANILDSLVDFSLCFSSFCF